VEVLHHYRIQENYLLHDFVVMPDHFHLLITPAAGITLERAMQLIKGGFSFRARQELGFKGEIWQNSFYDRLVRDWEEFQRFREYIQQNPVKKGLVVEPEKYAYSSTGSSECLDEAPQRLKPLSQAV